MNTLAGIVIMIADMFMAEHGCSFVNYGRDWRSRSSASEMVNATLLSGVRHTTDATRYKHGHCTHAVVEQ